MTPADPNDVTGLLQDWRTGKQGAADRLMEAVYGELHRIASLQMRREHAGHTLQATALLHETYLRLSGSQPIDWQNRAHFFAVAAQQLRRVLVDHARRSQREKRGGGKIQFSWNENVGPVANADERLVEIDQALSRLEAMDERAARVVELRYFGGLTEKEAAEQLKISVATLKRDWDFARTWLASQLM